MSGEHRYPYFSRRGGTSAHVHSYVTRRGTLPPIRVSHTMLMRRGTYSRSLCTTGNTVTCFGAHDAYTSLLPTRCICRSACYSARYIIVRPSSSSSSYLMSFRHAHICTTITPIANMSMSNSNKASKWNSALAR